MTKRARKRSAASQAVPDGLAANGEANGKTTAGNGAATAAGIPAESLQPTPEGVSAETTAGAEPIPNILADPHAGRAEIRGDAGLIARMVRERWPSTAEIRHAIRRKVQTAILQTTDHRSLAYLARVDAILEQQNQRDELAQNNAPPEAADGERATGIDPAAFDALARQFARSGATFISVRSATVIAPQQPSGHGNGALGG